MPPAGARGRPLASEEWRRSGGTWAPSRHLGAVLRSGATQALSRRVAGAQQAPSRRPGAMQRSGGAQALTRLSGAVRCSAGAQQPAPSRRCGALGALRSSPCALGLCSALQAPSCRCPASGAALRRPAGAQETLCAPGTQGRSGAHKELWGCAVLSWSSAAGAQQTVQRPRGAQELSMRLGAVQCSAGTWQQVPGRRCSGAQAPCRRLGAA